jgi:hypothetical protein
MIEPLGYKHWEPKKPRRLAAAFLRAITAADGLRAFPLLARHVRLYRWRTRTCPQVVGTSVGKAQDDVLLTHR